MSDDADKELLDYQRGVEDAKAGIRPAGAVEANAALAEARARQRRFTNEELERFWAPPEWGVIQRRLVDGVGVARGRVHGL